MKNEKKFNQIRKFIKKNTIIFIIFVICIMIILSYIFTIDLPEIIYGIERWYNLFFQLSVGYVINFIFYITQVYLPNEQKMKVINSCIIKRIKLIIDYMNNPIKELGKKYLFYDNHQNYTESELTKIFENMLSLDELDIISTSNKRNFTTIGYIYNNILYVEDGIDKLFRYYAPYISENIMVVLE